jgi:tetratricopeptide (TPR) repeat protein
MFPFQENLLQLWRESRGNVIGGVLAVIILAVAGLFWKSILKALRRLVNGPSVAAAPQVSPPAQEIHLKVEAVQATPAESPPVIRTTSRNPLPRPPIAGFVARRDQNGRDIVERLKEELEPAKEQLIVLWGAGGVGKTTLAAETARAMRAVFEGGIIWTSADGKPDFSFSTLLDDIATHLGRLELRQLAPASKDNEVHDALSKAPDALIVLDNFETVSPEEQEKCAEWLANRASCPALITSRDEVSPARPIRILAMSEPEAHEFLQRLISEAHNPHAFEQLDREQIILASDRIPLVLQWVVKRIDSAKQPRTVLDELSHGEGDAAKRVFDRSFDLPQVGDDGRAVLLALSLFVPAASRNALANVSGFANDEKRLEAALQQLIELWLIQTSENNERIRVEGLTRELAKARLGKDSSFEEYRQRFVSYFREYTEKYLERSPEDYEALELEKDNLVSAIDTAFELTDWHNVTSLAYNIALPEIGMLSIRGYWAEALKVNQQALEAARQSNSRLELADFAHNLAVIHGNCGELKDAQELYNESLKISRELANQQGIANTLHQLALLSQLEGKYAEAHRGYSESLEIQRKLGNQLGIATSLHQLALLSHLEGKYAEAHQGYSESLEIHRKLGNQLGIATGLLQLGSLAREQEKLAEARGLLDESLNITRRLGDQFGMAFTLNMLGRLAEDEKNLKEAARLFEEALSIFEKLKSPRASMVRQNLERVRGK